MSKPCPYCGNNPVPHFLNWYFESVNVLLSPLRRFLLFNPAAEMVFALSEKVHFSLLFTKLFSSLGVITQNTDRSNCVIGRAQVLWEEAERRGITMTELKLFGRSFDTYAAISKTANGQSSVQKKIIFSGLPRPQGYNRSSLDSMDDKLLLKQKLAKAGLPVPQGGSVTTLFGAQRLARKIWAEKSPASAPVIVKPRAGSRGRHSTTFVSSESDLREAFRIAKKLCHWVIVEEMLFGPVYRATVIDYSLQGVLRGDAPSVSGDGVSNIRQLIEKKNNQSHEGVLDIQISGSTELFLHRQGLTLESIPNIAKQIFLSEKVGVSYGGSSSEDYDICHRETKELFEQAARVVADPIIGFDFIIGDIAQSWKTQKCGFIEANSLPFINLHHHPLLGQPRNVAASVWNLIGF